MYSSSPLYKARCWPGARIDANRGKRSYEWKMDTLVRQNKRKEKVKGAEKRFRGNACIVKGSGACRADTDRPYRFPLALSRYNR